VKRFFVVTLEILICFLLQTTVFQWFRLAGVTPNLLLILTVSIGFMRGRKEGLFIGFICGLLIDVYYGNLIGICALIYLVIGYLSGYANKIFAREDLSIPLLLIGVGEFIYFFLYYVLEFLLRGRLNIIYYFIHIGFPRIIYTVVVSTFMYKLLNKINSLLEHRTDEEV
jgi:rod shape-determining protein MreD